MSQEIAAPTPGIFWHRPAPDAPVFAEPGDPIAKGDVVGVIEVMKMFMNIEAPAGGVFVEYLAPHGESVAMGSPLLAIEATSS